jgi:hypothetical protein
MIGTLSRKYHVAIVDSDPGFVKTMVQALTEWYSNKVVVQTYTDRKRMFLEMNIAAAKEKPFDMAIMKTDELPTSMVLKRTNPSVKVVMCDNVQKLKQETAKVMV